MRGKEMKVETKYQYNVVSGTVDNKNPKSVYIQISAWGKPKESDVEGYDTIIRNKSKRVKRKLFEVLDKEHFHTKKSLKPKILVSPRASQSNPNFTKIMQERTREDYYDFASKNILKMARNVANSETFYKVVKKELFKKKQNVNYLRK